jgi:flagellar motility protein MotE (MotC chaperone)
LNRIENELTAQKEELEKRMKELEKTRSNISSVLEEKVKADDQKIDTLVQMYSTMKPQQAAKVFETLDEDLSVEIISRMKKKNAAEILNLLKPEKAQMFSEKFAGYKKK